MAEPLILALDQGTTSTRAILFDARGRALAEAGRPLEQFYPADGWVEHDAEAIFQASRGGAARGGAEGRAGRMAEVAAIGITNQRETVVIWDKATGKPIHQAIVWQDRRTAAICDRLRAAGHEGRVTEITGLLLDPYFSGTKIAWLLDQVEGARARAEAGELLAGTIDAWVIWKLTGGARPRHRRHQRLAHPAVRHPQAGLVGGDGRDAGRAARHACRRCCDCAGDFGETDAGAARPRPSRSAAWPATSRRR